MEHQHISFIESTATALGTSEKILSLIICLFAGYLVGFFYRRAIYGRKPYLQNLFFTVSGLGACYFMFGTDAIHTIVNILLVYAILLITPGTRLSVGLAFVINMVYLCTGYYFNSSTNYDVTWTIPQCVLTLRLTGLVVDVYDGKKKKDDLSKEQRETALEKVPSLLEIAGHACFIGGFLVGPQFSLARYQDLVKGKFSDKITGGPPASITAALTRLMGGVSYIAIYQISALFLNQDYLTSADFQGLSFIYKCLVVLIWGKLLLYRYVGVWLMAEGSCILTGLTYNGRDENGNDLWDGCANVHVREYESASTLENYIRAFNINTNKWMAQYVFKRLRFLGNKNVSQMVTLMFLAIWHGLYTGYFANFFLEFFLMKFEREVGSLLSQSRIVKSIAAVPGHRVFLWIVKKCYAQFVLSYALVSFCLLSYDMYMQVYTSLWFVVHVVCFVWLIVYPQLKRQTKTSTHIPEEKDSRRVKEKGL